MEKKKLNILVIGGTRFVGRHIVEEAQARNHYVTLFNRGTNNCFSGITHIKGDRDNPEDLRQLSGMVFDSIIDTCGFYPRQIQSLTKVMNHTLITFSYQASAFTAIRSALSVTKARL